MVGSQITADALRRGHEVASLSRTGTPVAGATAVAASLDDLKTFQSVAARNDAVVIAVPPPRTGEPHEPFLAAHGARRRPTVDWRGVLFKGSTLVAGATATTASKRRSLLTLRTHAPSFASTRSRPSSSAAFSRRTPMGPPSPPSSRP